MSAFVLFLLAVGCLLAWKARGKYGRGELATRGGYENVRQATQYRWLFGIDMALKFAWWINRRTSLEESTKWMEQNGKTFSVLIAGQDAIYTADARIARTVLAYHAEDFELSSFRQKAFHPLVGKGMIATNGADWAEGRTILRHTLVQKQVRNLQLYENHVQRIIATLPTDGATVDLKDPLKLFSMDVSSLMLLGKSTGWLTAGLCPRIRAINQAIDYASQTMRRRSDMGPWVHLHFDAKFDQACKTIHKFIEPYIDENISIYGQYLQSEPDRSPEGPDQEPRLFIQELIRRCEHIETVRDHLVTTLLAGRDTTASLIGFTLWNLAKHPKVQQVLRSKIGQLGGGNMNYEEMMGIVYLRWIIKEVLRLYPSIPANDRVAKKDTYLPYGGGRNGTCPAFVPKGRTIDIHVYAMHRDRSIWGGDAESFKPERWEKDENPPSFMPFGVGPRSCPGQELAMVLTAYLVVRLLQTYSKLEDRDSGPFREQVSITLSSSSGFKVAFTI